MERYDEHLQFDLPEGYETERSVNKEGKDVFRILYGVSLGDDGQKKAELSFTVSRRDDVELTEEKVNLKGTLPCALLATVKEANVAIFTVQVLVAVAVVGKNGNSYAVVANKVGRTEADVKANAEQIAPRLHEVLDSIVLDGERGSFAPISAARLLGEEEEENSEFRQAVPGEDQHSQLDFQKNARSRLGFLGGMVQINATGTEYSFQSVREMAENNEGSAADLLEAAAGADRGGFALSDRALEMAELFRVNMEAFDVSHDREQEIRGGMIQRAATYNGLRSFAWTLSAYCRDHDTEPGKVPFDTIRRLAAFLERRKWLNYQADENCPTLCAGDDIHVYYLPDAVPPADRRALLDRVNEGAEDAISRCSVMSLDGLRRDLAYLSPAMETIYQALAADRDRSEALEGGAADVLYAWCSMTYAAREPIFTEDGPMNNWFEHPEQQARWEEEWRRQREEAEKQAAREWMKAHEKHLTRGQRIQFADKKFVFAGVEGTDEWLEILEKLTARGGVHRTGVSGKTDYLVCDPRRAGDSKVRAALEQNIKGKNVKIILLEDLLAALGIQGEKNAPETGPAPEKTAPAADPAAEQRRKEAEERERQQAERRRQEEEQRLAYEEQKRQQAEEARKREEERRRLEEEARAREEERRRQAEEEKRRAAVAYEEERKAWEMECGRVRHCRKEALDTLVEDRRKELTDEAQKRLSAAEKAARERIDQAEKERAAAEKRLSALGFFSFSEKKQQKEIIARAEETLAKGKKELEQAGAQYKDELERLEEKLKKVLSSEKSRLEREMPLPREPKKPASVLAEERRQAEEKAAAERRARKEDRFAIPNAMEPGKIYTPAEIGEMFGETASWATPKLNALVAAGVLVRTVDRRLSFYSLA